jgi:hypothetical protein
LIPEALYKSTNAGSSWTLAVSGMSECVNSLAISPSNPAILCAGACAGVYTTNSGASSWTAAGLPTDNIGTVSVDPQNPAVVFATKTVNWTHSSPGPTLLARSYSIRPTWAGARPITATALR